MDILWLSVVDDKDQHVELSTYSIGLPKGVESNSALRTTQDRLAHLIRATSIERVRLLDAESNYKATYHSFVGRLTLETLLALAAAIEDVDFARMNRNRVRSILSLPKTKPLNEHAESVCEAVAPNWGPNKRDLASMTAIAGRREDV